MHTNKPTYDTSLAEFCNLIVAAGYADLLEACWFVRNAAGALALIVPDDSAIDMAKLRASVAKGLGPYSQHLPENVAKQSGHHLGESHHLALPEVVELSDKSFQKVYVIDQRANGQDWLIPPAAAGELLPERPPRLVFWSLKGGVGRTTALSVLAASLADDGQNVLVIDLDLEAPGVGDQLLREEDRPSYGVLDYLTESRLGAVNLEEALTNAVGTSRLTRGAGLVHVCPAAGALTYMNPVGFLGKLFRVYGTQSIGGVETTFAQRINKLIDGLTGRVRYDAVLIDARAGLSESTAASILNLHGDVLLFGHNTPQTFSGYRYAFAHLQRFVLDGNGEWMLRIKMVHAKASLSRADQGLFRDNSFDMFSSYLYGDDEDFSFSLEDQEAPHYAWVIPDDSNFRDFNPVDNSEMLDSAVTNSTFGDFVRACRERLRV